MLEDSNVIFRERQNIGRFLRWFIVVDSIFVLAFFVIIMKFVIKDSDALPIWVMLIMFVMPVIMPFIFFLVRLETEVRFDGLYFRLFPLNIGFKKISYGDIIRYELREFSPIRDYGGWGIRYSWRHGKAYIISGTTGLSLTLKNGKQVLISTKQPEEMIGAFKSVAGVLGGDRSS